MLEEYQLPNWCELQRDRSALFVLHTLYLHGARFPPTFASEHPQIYESFINTMREAIQCLVTSDEAHSVSLFDLLPDDEQTAWALLELLLRSGFFLFFLRILLLARKFENTYKLGYPSFIFPYFSDFISKHFFLINAIISMLILCKFTETHS